MTVVTEFDHLPLDALILYLRHWPGSLPVRAAEALLRHGSAAADKLAAALADSCGDEALSLAVVAGELRHPGTIAPLCQQIRVNAQIPVLIAAAEALAKIGNPAVPALMAELGTNDRSQVCAVAALVWIGTPESLAVIGKQLDGPAADVIANALTETNRREFVGPLFEAYQRCPTWQRPELEDAVRDLHHGRSGDTPLHMNDWRLRYRPASRPPFDLGWLGICLLIRQEPGLLARREVLPLRTFAEIIDHVSAPDEDAPRTHCPRCGEAFEHPTGLATCSETMLPLLLQQHRWLDDAREQGIDDLFTLLDDVEEQRAAADDETPDSRMGRRRLQDHIAMLECILVTCRWAIGQGIETVPDACARVMAIASEARERFGDPLGALSPPADRTRPTSPRVGRNEPCPCGSGVKFKRCCGGVRHRTA